MIGSPTGTGKGVMQQALARDLDDCWILSPSLEVLRSYADRWGIEAKHKVLWEHKLSTPTRFRNRLLDGTIDPPDVIIHDEAHHATMASVVTEDILACCPLSAHLGFTATTYRASAKSTAKLRDLWGQPLIVLTMESAVRNGWMSMPSVRTEPLLDDDCLRVVNGQFVIESINEEWNTRVESLVALIKRTRAARPGGIMVSLPSTVLVGLVQRVCDEQGIEAVNVTQATSDPDRVAAYNEAENHHAVLLQISVVGEGVDLPWMRTLIDAKPTLSPVLWMQQFGRITRPHEIPAQYICTNRNLERHAYLAEGLIPAQAIVEAQDGFESPTDRIAGRFLGLEAVGKLMAIPIPMNNGMVAAAYNINTSDELHQTEYYIICLPHIPDPIVFTRQNSNVKWVDQQPTRQWGKWKLTEMPAELLGYRSSNSRNRLSDKQRAWWKKSAAQKGLDPTKHEKLTGRQFAILPALYDTRLTLKGLI